MGNLGSIAGSTDLVQQQLHFHKYQPSAVVKKKEHCQSLREKRGKDCCHLPWDAEESEELGCSLLFFERAWRGCSKSKSGEADDGSISIPSECSPMRKKVAEWNIFFTKTSGSERGSESLWLRLTTDVEREGLGHRQTLNRQTQGKQSGSTASTATGQVP